MTDPRFDTIEGCVNELTECNRAIAGIAHEWAHDAGELKRLEKSYGRLYKEALRVTQGANADERAALAHATAEEVYRSAHELSEDEPGLSEQIENLVGRVEANKTLFATIERRSSNVQSIIRMRREEARLDPYVPREERT
jgi:hypothetical protein